MATQTKQVTLNPGESETVSFAVTPNVKKIYSVDIEGLHGTFEAIEIPVADFVVTDLVVTPSRVYIGETVTISVTVSNIGNVAGTKTITLEVT